MLPQLECSILDESVIRPVPSIQPRPTCKTLFDDDETENSVKLGNIVSGKERRRPSGQRRRRPPWNQRNEKKTKQQQKTNEERKAQTDADVVGDGVIEDRGGCGPHPLRRVTSTAVFFCFFFCFCFVFLGFRFPARSDASRRCSTKN